MFVEGKFILQEFVFHEFVVQVDKLFWLHELRFCDQVQLEEFSLQVKELFIFQEFVLCEGFEVFCLQSWIQRFSEVVQIEELFNLNFWESLSSSLFGTITSSELWDSILFGSSEAKEVFSFTEKADEKEKTKIKNVVNIFLKVIILSKKFIINNLKSNIYRI